VPDVALSIELSAEVVEAYERRDSERYREFCIPASLLNQYGVMVVQDLEDVDVADRRWRSRALETP
jgi:hypothetical protein